MVQKKTKENNLPKAAAVNNKGKSPGEKPNTRTIGYLRTQYPNHNERCKSCGHAFVYHIRRIRTKLCDYNSRERRTCGCRKFVPKRKAAQVSKNGNAKARRHGKKKNKPSKQRLSKRA